MVILKSLKLLSVCDLAGVLVPGRGGFRLRQVAHSHTGVHHHSASRDGFRMVDAGAELHTKKYPKAFPESQIRLSLWEY